MVNFIKFDPKRNHHEFIDPLLDEEWFDMLATMEIAGRNCYKSTPGTGINIKTSIEFLRKIIKMGHFSLLEHGKLTVKFTDVSRGFTHSIVRNRLATFSQQSTVHAVENDKEMRIVIPPDLGEHQYALYVGQMNKVEDLYRRMRVLKCDRVQTRYVLPIAICNDIVMTANMRQWRHIFIMRTKRGEDWENLKVIGALLRDVQKLCPVLFEDFEPDGENEYGIPYYKEKFGA